MRRFTFETREYEFSHGRRPRGDGCWAFKLVAVFGQDGVDLNQVYYASGTLGEAKRKFERQIRQEYAHCSHVIAKVLP